MSGDRILDVGLDELLGGVSPPDLTDRILQSLGQQGTSPVPSSDGARELSNRGVNESGVNEALENEPGVNEFPGLTSCPGTVQTTPSSSTGRRTKRGWGLPLAVAIGVAACVLVAVSILGSLFHKDPARSVTENLPPEVTRPTPPAPKARKDEANSSTANSSTANSSTANSSSATRPTDDPEPRLATRPAPPRASAQPASGETIRSALPTESGTANGPQVAALPAAMADRAIVDRLNELIRANWVQHKVEPSPLVSDGHWFQRLYAVVLGREPNAAETEAFGRATQVAKREMWLGRLLSDGAFAEEFARHWGRFWVDLFLDADVIEENRLANREGMLQYFRRGLLERKSFRDVATELITATGSGVPGDQDYDGAVNFLLARGDTSRIRATSDVARLFLGRNVECQQCHDDPHFDGGKQNQFWELNTFLRQLAFQRDEANKRTRLVDADFRGDNRQGESAGVFFSLPGGVMKVAFPTFVDGTKIPANGFVTQVNRRRELAKMVADSADFRRNIANRVWAAVIGRPFVDFDQVVRNNVMDHPAPLIILGDQFAAHGFDVRKVVQWAVMSQPFQLASNSGSLAEVDREGEMPLFDQYYEDRRTKLRPGQDVLAVAMAELNRVAVNGATTAKLDSLPPSRDKKGKAVVGSPTKTAEIFQSGGLPADPMAKVVLTNEKLTNQQKAEHLFQMALHRPPRGRETKVLDDILKKSSDKPQDALRHLDGAQRRPR